MLITIVYKEWTTLENTRSRNISRSSILYPLSWMIFICLTIVDLPHSPAPKRSIFTSFRRLFWAFLEISARCKKHHDTPRRDFTRFLMKNRKEAEETYWKKGILLCQLIKGFSAKFMRNFMPYKKLFITDFVEIGWYLLGRIIVLIRTTLMIALINLMVITSSLLRASSIRLDLAIATISSIWM